MEEIQDSSLYPQIIMQGSFGGKPNNLWKSEITPSQLEKIILSKSLQLTAWQPERLTNSVAAGDCMQSNSQKKRLSTQVWLLQD